MMDSVKYRLEPKLGHIYSRCVKFRWYPTFQKSQSMRSPEYDILMSSKNEKDKIATDKEWGKPKGFQHWRRSLPWNAWYTPYIIFKHKPQLLGHLSGIFTWCWNTLVSDSVCGCKYVWTWELMGGHGEAEHTHRRKVPSMQRRAEINHHVKR